MSQELQFGFAEPGTAYTPRPAAFGVVEREGRIACVRVTQQAASWTDLPGGAVDPWESEAEALVREFREETGLAVEPGDVFARAAQRFRKSDGQPVNNLGAFFTARAVAYDPAAKVEDDHELVWLEPAEALKALRHDAHAWAVTAWLRRD